jgi:Fe-S-cluster-containing hydrogenase component 2
MDTESCFLIVRCLECTQKVCAVICENAALALMRGDLLIDTQKCADCNSSGFRQGLPECVAACTHAGQKAIITETSIDDKRTQAVNTLSLIL